MATEQFKKVIQSKMEEMANNDKLFAISYQKKNKNIDDCIRYILNTVKKSGCCGFSDDEIFGMAAHYYDEDDIKVGGNVSCKIVTNHTVELSEEEKQQAKQKAIDIEIEQQRSKLRIVKSPKKTQEEKSVFTQQSLF